MLEDNENYGQEKGDCQKQISVERLFESGFRINFIVIVGVSPQEGPEPECQDNEFYN